MSSSIPSASDPSTLPVQFLKGIGPRKSAALEKFGIRTVFDLMLHVPRRYLDRTAIVSIADLRAILASGSPAAINDSLEPEGSPGASRDYTVVGEVRSFRVVGFGQKSRFVLVLADHSGSLQCVWFGGVHYWKNVFRAGDTIAVSGRPSFYNRVLQFVHPDLDRISSSDQEDEQDQGISRVDWSRMLNTGGLVPLYSSGQELARVGLDSAGFRRAIRSALHRHIDGVVEILPDSISKSNKFITLRQALQAAHFPKSNDDLKEGIRRLKYEELFRFQLKLALKRHWLRVETQGIAFAVRSTFARQLIDSLPFSLTKAQVRVIKEISGDMEAARPMNRLLQGDVGSGKTIVALVAMLIAVQNGFQALFMAPTEILAEQHFQTLSALLKGVGVNIRLLVGAQRARLRRDILEDVRSGAAQIVVGTHALFEKEVEFAKLGFVVIDEQHRFGVLQRALVRKKGVNPDVLVMTATPIPRTLSLTLFGDLDVSIIDEMPKDRKPVRTLLKYDTERESVHQFVREQIREGRQAYFVYPLIEESEKLDLKAATVYYEHMRREVFPDLRLALIHGRLPSEEKDEVMERFKRKETDVLVATTVIEVGIDVPNASLMVIEDAERFGLSQLHQLRGRVGRGSDQSYCILIAKRWIARRAARITDPESEQASNDERRLAARRLATMVSTSDGFRIAEVDLDIRGPGDFFGTRQSGLPEFRVADIITDGAILEAARRDAFALVENDPGLVRPEHRALAEHLRTHFRDEVSLLRVG